MSEIPTASVILSTYNRPQMLRLVLLGYQRQTFKDFELIIADDGSTDEVKGVIEEFKNNSFFNIVHMWHEDKGWKRCEIVNKSILAANSDYLIFSDADIIPHHDFVKIHIEYRQKGAVLLGRCVRWGEWISGKITKKEVITGRYERLTWDKWLAFFRGRIKHFQKSIPIKNKFLLKWLNPTGRRINLYGMNFSMWKEDMLKLNGFDEKISHWGVEDVELDLRVRKLGLKRISVRHQAICYHLYHPKSTKKPEDTKIVEQTEKSNDYFCKYGIVK